MKRLLVAVAVCLMIPVFAAPAQAIGPFIGYWDSENAGDGFGLGVRRTVFSAAVISIEPRLSYYRLEETSLNLIPVEAAAIASLSLFYGGVGGGWYIINNNIKDQLGFFALAGLQLKLVGFGPFAEVKYTDVTSEFNDAPEIKVDMSGFSVNVGVNIGLID